MKNRKYLRFVPAIFLSCSMLPALAQQSPMMTVLRKPHASAEQVAPADTDAMLRGFVACDPRAALPAKILSPLGVRFLDQKQAAGVRFVSPSQSALRETPVLQGNDPANMETTPEGLYMIYGGKYKLKKRIKFSDGIELTGVSEMVSTYGHRPRVGVTYTFKGAAGEALGWIERQQRAELKSRIDHVPEESSGEVWYTLSDDGRSAACWRFID